jgi:DnaJ-class molecular chaperone
MTFYDDLEVEENATPEDIKKQYRKLSLQFHPDRPTGDAAKFKTINEAYEVLSDNVQRQQYDQSLHVPDIMEMLFQGRQRPDSLFEMMFNANEPILFMMKPPPLKINLELTLEQAFLGCCTPVNVDRRGQRTETVYVDVPPGVDDNEVLTLPGKGSTGPDGSVGDLKIGLTVRNTTKFVRHGLDLTYTHPISLKEALCGFLFELEYFEEKRIKINNTTGTVISPSFKKVIPNLGMQRDHNRGSLTINFDIAFPTTLTPEQRTAVESLF